MLNDTEVWKEIPENEENALSSPHYIFDNIFRGLIKNYKLNGDRQSKRIQAHQYRTLTSATWLMKTKYWKRDANSIRNAYKKGKKCPQ